MAKKSFTLIELLVVIAIIAVLVSLLLPSLNQARVQAKRTICTSNLKQIGTAFYSYEMDFNNFPLVTYNPYMPPYGSGKDNYWQFQLAKYLGYGMIPESKMTFCPGNWTGDQALFPDRQMKIYQCPASFTVPSEYGWSGNSLGINRYLYTTYVPKQYVAFRSLEKPDRTFVLMDSRRYIVGDGTEASYGRPHADFKNILFCDLHVKTNYRDIYYDVTWLGGDLWGDTEWIWLR